MRLELPLVMDMVKAKIRLEENKAKAQKAAQDAANLKNGNSNVKFKKH